MAALNIRSLPEDVRDRLRVRAAEAGRSMEAESRAVLTEACSRESSERSAKTLPDWVSRLYGKRKPRRVVDALIAERRNEAQR